MKVLCKHCSHFLFDATGTTLVSNVICPNSKCKAKLNIKIIFNNDATDSQIRQVIEAEERLPKSLAIIRTKE
jgi:hypothetical protein